MTLRGLAKKLGLPYSTTRKYLLFLNEKGLLRLKEGPVGFMLDEEAERVLSEFLTLVRAGYTSEGAVRKMRGELSEDLGSEILRRLDVLEEELKEVKEMVEKLTEKNHKVGWFWKIFRRKKI